MGRKKKDPEIDISIINKAENQVIENKEKPKAKRGRKSKKDLTPEELAKKEQEHKAKIKANQEKRLAEHERRQEIKEKAGDPANKERFYVTNAKLLEQLTAWRDSEPDKDGVKRIPEELGKMIIMIATKITNHSNFKNYPFDMKQDMVSTACYKCIQAVYNYNFEYKNPFAYFTMTSYNACLTVCSKHYKRLNLKKDYVKNAFEKIQSSNLINSQKLINNYIKEYLGDEFLDKDQKADE
jgi:hypothetical protein